MRRNTIGIKINLPPELAELIEQDAIEKGVPKSTYIRMLLMRYYKSYLQPQRAAANPLPPGAKGLEEVGDDRADEAQPFMREKAGGGEGG